MSPRAVSTREAKNKLAHLEVFLPNTSVESFGRFLVDYLNPELVPEGFILACEQALFDLESGISNLSREGELFQHPLVGQSSEQYHFLRELVPLIATAVFPADFASEVKGLLVDLHAARLRGASIH